MSAQPEVAVIGAGVAGLACASELARSDVTVTVLERARGDELRAVVKGQISASASRKPAA